MLQMDGKKSMILCVFTLLCLAVGAWKRAPVYDLFTEGAGEGIRTAAKILPSLIAMLSAIRALEASGLTEAICNFLAPCTEKIGLPADVLPLMFLRPVSGSASLAVLENLMKVHGPDSREALLAGVMMGSSETVFYTCGVYLSAAGVKDARHTVPCALLACIAGYAGALLFCR